METTETTIYPTPLNPAKSPPPFPIGALPPTIRDMVNYVAETTQVYPDMPAAVALAALSVCLQGKAKVYFSEHWAEELNLYILICAPPGERKSAVFSAMTRPITHYVAEYNENHLLDVQTYRNTRKQLEYKLHSNIDESRTHLNYNLAEKDQPLSCLDFLHKRMSEIKVLKRAKAAVDINTAAEYYGLNVRKDTALCPFHNEKTGSLKLYHDHFYCFGCGEHGDVIKLTGKLLGLSPIDSARRLASDFNVAIHDDSKPKGHTRNKYSPQKVVTYKERENRAFRLLANYCKYLEDCRIRYAPHTPEERPHPLFVTALCELEMLRYYRDLFIYGDFEERKAFIEEQGKLLDRISRINSQNAA